MCIRDSVATHLARDRRRCGLEHVVDRRDLRRGLERGAARKQLDRPTVKGVRPGHVGRRGREAAA
eukprot:6361051-Alexandrium_andersonii.AAC.1